MFPKEFIFVFNPYFIATILPKKYCRKWVVQKKDESGVGMEVTGGGGVAK